MTNRYTARYTTEDLEEAAVLQSLGCRVVEIGVDNATPWWQFEQDAAESALLEFNRQPESAIARFFRHRRGLLADINGRITQEP